MPPGPFPDCAWIHIPSSTAGRISGDSKSAVNEIVLFFDSLEATNVRTGTSELLYGTFMITHVDKEFVGCRPEIPSDMPCSDPNPVDPPKDKMPMYRIQSKIMLENLIQLKVRIAYPKGC